MSRRGRDEPYLEALLFPDGRGGVPASAFLCETARFGSIDVNRITVKLNWAEAMPTMQARHPTRDNRRKWYIVFFAYIDESGDTGMASSPTATFVLSCLLLHDGHWLSALDQTISFRRYLRDKFHITPRSELKAAWLIHNKGDIRHSGLSYSARLEAYRAAMRFQRKVGIFRIFSVLIAKTRIAKTPSDVREIAWRYAVQRLERFGTASKDNIHVLPDEGHGDFIRKKIRLMRRFNQVPSAFGGATLERNAENIVEDSSDRRSQESFFVQLADLNAYAAYRKVFPGATFGEGIWDELGSSRVLEVNSLRGGPPGIVVWPN